MVDDTKNWAHRSRSFSSALRLSPSNAPSSCTRTNRRHRAQSSATISTAWRSPTKIPPRSEECVGPSAFHEFNATEREHVVPAYFTTDKQKLLKSASVGIVSFFKRCNKTFRYKTESNPRRVLSTPGARVSNDMADNDLNDLILCVNDTLHCDSGVGTTRKKFRVVDLLGKGTFGQVVKCENTTTGEIVAVKVIKNKLAYYNQAVMEIRILKLLNLKFDQDDVHNIVRVHHYFVHKNHLCLVFELLNVNLYDLIKQNHYRGLSCNLVRAFTKQILGTMAVLRRAHVIHCDLKPENVLLKNLTSPQVKVIDFGSACHEGQTVYSYIQSRFYRAPEVLLGYSYNCAIDMWSVACIAAELFLGLPLFPGKDEYDQISRIINMLGMFDETLVNKAPSKKIDKYFARTKSDRGTVVTALKSPELYYAEQEKPVVDRKKYHHHDNFCDLIMKYPLKKGLSEEKKTAELDHRRSLLHFLQGLLQPDPDIRWTPNQALEHPFITGEALSLDWTPSSDPTPPPLPMEDAKVSSQDIDCRSRKTHEHASCVGTSHDLLSQSRQRSMSVQEAHLSYYHEHFVKPPTNATPNQFCGTNQFPPNHNPNTSMMVIDSSTSSSIAHPPQQLTLMQQHGYLNRQMLQTQGTGFSRLPPHSAPSSSSHRPRVSPIQQDMMRISPFSPHSQQQQQQHQSQQHQSQQHQQSPLQMSRKAPPFSVHQNQQHQMQRALRKQLSSQYRRPQHQENFQPGYAPSFPPHATISGSAVQTSPLQTRRRTRSSSDSGFDRGMPMNHRQQSHPLVPMSMVQEAPNGAQEGSPSPPSRKHSHKSPVFGTPDENLSNPSSGSTAEWEGPNLPNFSPVRQTHAPSAPNSQAPKTQYGFNIASTDSTTQNSSTSVAQSAQSAPTTQYIPLSQQLAPQQVSQVSQAALSQAAHQQAMHQQPSRQQVTYQQAAQQAAHQQAVGAQLNQQSQSFQNYIAMGGYNTPLQFSPPSRDFRNIQQNFIPVDVQHRPMGVTTGLTPQQQPPFLNYQNSPEGPHRRGSFQSFMSPPHSRRSHTQPYIQHQFQQHQQQFQQQLSPQMGQQRRLSHPGSGIPLQLPTSPQQQQQRKTVQRQS